MALLAYTFVATLSITSPGKQEDRPADRIAHTDELAARSTQRHSQKDVRPSGSSVMAHQVGHEHFVFRFWA